MQRRRSHPTGFNASQPCSLPEITPMGHRGQQACPGEEKSNLSPRLRHRRGLPGLATSPSPAPTQNTRPASYPRRDRESAPRGRAKARVWGR